MERAEIRQQIVEHYLDYYALAMSMLEDDDDARDAVQEAMAKTFAMPLLKDPVNYCFQTVRHEAVNVLRHRWRTVPLSGQHEELSDSEDASYAELLERVRNLRMGLPKSLRSLVKLHYEKGLSINELQKITGYTHMTIWRKLREAEAMIKKQLEEEK